MEQETASSAAGYGMVEPSHVAARENMAARNSQSEYQQAARQKWPTVDIVGDGPYALVCRVTNSVYLHSFWMAAMNDLTKNHSNWQCRDDHKLVELTTAPQRPVRIRNRSLLERD